MNVKTTTIEKKYKDKKTGEYKSIKIEHAKVKDRLKAFWEENPRGKIETTPTIQTGGMTMFKTTILRDKADPHSREATAHSLGNVADEKSFEKLETISVGRCLALLGYATDGEIASSEEMEEFEAYQRTKKEERLFELQGEIDEINTIEELKTFYTKNKGLGKEFDAMVTARKIVITKKTELQNGK